MKKKSKKYYVPYCILAAMLFLCGCGNGSGVGGSQKANEIEQEETVYVAQPVLLPEYASFDGACSDGDNLYYAAADFNQDTRQHVTAFYTMKQGAAEPEMNFRLAENQRVQSMTMDTEGNIYYVGYEEIPQDGGDSQSAPALMLYKVDLKGAPLLALDLAEYTGGQEQAIIQDMAVDGEKRIVLSASSQHIYVLNPDGSLLFETRAAERLYGICSSNGKVFAGCADGSGIVVREIDIPGKKLSAKSELTIPGTQFYMAAGANGTLLVASEESVYRYTPETEEIIKKFDWQTYDSAGISSGILLPFGENGVLAVSRNYGTDPVQTEATAFREAVEGEAISIEKTVVTLGVAGPIPLPSGISAEIVYFNKANPDVKIEVKNYEEDYTRLNTEVIAGNAPDLLVLPSDRMNQFTARGFLEDLNPYFEGDETLDRSDFLENILDAFETKGHLYGMPLSFRIDTMVGKTSVVGEGSGWNLDDFIAFAGNAPEGGNIFDNTSKSGVLRLLKYAYSGQLVDTDNTSNPLNKELLVKMLEFANQYENNDRYVYDADLSGKIREKPVMLPDIRVCSGHDYFGCSGLFGEPVTFIGYPCEEGNGHLIYSRNTLTISANSEHKDIAWKFISTLLSEESQMRMEKDYSTMGFHIRKDALEAHFAFIMERARGYFMTTANGDNNAQYLFKEGDVREEDIEPIRKLIESADMVLTISPDIDQIIEEEAAIYFSGTKPVEEVVDVIENRVRTYVNESK